MIAWFARNSVAANLLLFTIVVWGLFTLTRLPLEVFPSFDRDAVQIRTSLRGASPTEIEEGISIKIEEAIQSVDGIKEISSVSSEGLSTVTASMKRGVNSQTMLDDIKQQIDQLNDLPADADPPGVYIPKRNREVISVLVAGDSTEQDLHAIAIRIRDDLENLPDISSVALSGARDFELAIEVPSSALISYGLTLQDIANAVSRSSLDLAGGAIRTPGGEVLLRASGKADTADQYRNIVVLSRDDGTRVTLGQLASISDGFVEDQLDQTFNNLSSIEIDVFRRGDESAIKVANQVKDYLATVQSDLPAGIRVGYWRDRSRIVKARLNTLLKSALQGSILIILLLTLFLRFWVAVWVFVGVPVSILGGIAMMPFMGVTINLISLFAFILVLGIVVDDAIVTGENIYKRMREDPDRINAAIRGTHQIAVPVTFGVLTTVAAFTPLLMVEGIRGKIFAQIPVIVIPVLLFSLIESKLILPSHLSHINFHSDKKPNIFARIQRKIASGLEWGVEHLYQPVLALALRYRYATIALFVGTLIVVQSLVSAGHIRFIFFPRVQSEVAQARLIMPQGTPYEATKRHIDRIAAAANTLKEKHIDPDTGESVIMGILASAGSNGGSSRGDHLGRVMFEIVPPEERSLPVTSSELVREWRRLIGSIPGSHELTYRAEIGGGGSPIDIQLKGDDFDRMAEVANRFKAELLNFSGISDVTDSLEGGKQEIQMSLRPQAELMGLSLADVANQVRQAFLGLEVQSIQRNRDDVSVIVRYPQAERRSLQSLESMPIRTPSGEFVPFSSLVDANNGRGFTSIRRTDRKRTVNITADVDKSSTNIEGVKADLQALAESLATDYPDISVGLEGEAREQRDSFGSLKTGLWLVLAVVYALLAIPFRSYLQPILVMLVIPFGVVGAILGHMILGMNLSIMSYMGMLALVGVVVNDSLVLVDYVNKTRSKHALFDAVRMAGVARFRPVILTSLTTFFGLMPLIFEKSTQAQFLIPMAVSLGFGILFATFITLLLVPVNYLVLEDIKYACKRVYRGADRLLFPS